MTDQITWPPPPLPYTAHDLAELIADHLGAASLFPNDPALTVDVPDSTHPTGRRRFIVSVGELT